jgi:hypothetical protein
MATLKVLMRGGRELNISTDREDTLLGLVDQILAKRDRPDALICDQTSFGRGPAGSHFRGFLPSEVIAFEMTNFTPATGSQLQAFCTDGGEA